MYLWLDDAVTSLDLHYLFMVHILALYVGRLGGRFIEHDSHTSVVRLARLSEKRVCGGTSCGRGLRYK
jgi:hypothetical protein